MDKPTTPNNSNRQYKGNENRLIFKALIEAKQPLTRRELSKRTGLEISALCRALFNLIYFNRTLKISHYAPCKTTGRTVMHFVRVKEVQNGK